MQKDFTVLLKTIFLLCPTLFLESIEIKGSTGTKWVNPGQHSLVKHQQ